MSTTATEPRTESPQAPFSRMAELKANLKALPRPVWILCLGTFINKFGSFVIPFLALYLTGQGFTMANASMALAAYGLGHFVATGLGGYLADRIGRRKTICFSMFLAALTMVLLAYAQSLESILALAFLVGLAGEFYRPACGALLADLVPSEQRVTAYATYRLALNAGWAFGPATAGFIAKYSYFWLFIGDAVTSALYGVIAWFALPKGIRSATTDCRWSLALRSAWDNKAFMTMMISSLAVGLVFFQMSSTYGLQVMAWDYSEKVYGLLISLNGILVVLFELPITAYTKRCDNRRVMAVGFALVGIGFALLAIPTLFSVQGGLTLLIIAIVLFTIGEMIGLPLQFAAIADLAPEEMRGRYMGLYGYTWSVALITGPGLGILLFGAYPGILWLLCGALGLFAAVTVLSRR